MIFFPFLIGDIVYVGFVKCENIGVMWIIKIIEQYRGCDLTI